MFFLIWLPLRQVEVRWFEDGFVCRIRTKVKVGSEFVKSKNTWKSWIQFFANKSKAKNNQKYFLSGSVIFYDFISFCTKIHNSKNKFTRKLRFRWKPTEAAYYDHFDDNFDFSAISTQEHLAKLATKNSNCDHIKLYLVKRK